MTNRLEYLLFVGFSFLFKILGLKLSRKFATVLAFLFFYFIPIRKETTIENLTKAFPEFPPEKIKKIAFECYRSFAIAMVEILYLPQIRNHEAAGLVKITNPEFAFKKYQEGKGLILLTAHFGNWEYLGITAGLQMKVPYSIIVKMQRNTLVNDWLNKFRTKWGNAVIPLGISIRDVYKALKEKRIVAMAADQRGAADGIRVNFFGRKASAYPGPAMLALKTNTPILYCIAVRQPDYSYTAEFVEVDMNNLPENDDEKVAELCQRLADYLEVFIRRNPEQWLWMHKRWKY
jgi:Kdo2-lipid IVA lauroyltransferase/acyltransferase